MRRPTRRLLLQTVLVLVTVAAAVAVTVPEAPSPSARRPDVAGQGTAPAPAPSVPAATYPGRPVPGKVRWGAAVGGNGDPVARHEIAAEAPLGLRRTFFQWHHRDGWLLDVARGDLAAGRMPWVSVKTPSWAAMASGHHDEAIDELLEGLDALDGPVWLTIHHEPEGGGGVNRPDDPAGPEGHVAMNRRVRQRMNALGVDNVALLPVLMGWSWHPASDRDPDAWWQPGIYDLLGVDVYADDEASVVGATWGDIRRWAAQRGVDVAVGEWGMRGVDAAAGARVRDLYATAAGSHVDGRGARVVGLAAFDSGLNSPSGSWELRGAQLTAFHDLLRDPRTATLDVDAPLRAQGGQE